MDPLHPRPATMLDVLRVLRDLRDEDRLEIESLGFTTDTAFEALCTNASAIYAVDWDGEVAAVFGVSPEPGMEGAARVWVLQRPHQAPRRLYLSLAREMLPKLAEGFDVLFNWKWVGNDGHLPWLQRLGFTVLRTVQIRGEHYREFVRIS